MAASHPPLEDWEEGWLFREIVAARTPGGSMSSVGQAVARSQRFKTNMRKNQIVYGKAAGTE
jgi:hypothetical protein